MAISKIKNWDGGYIEVDVLGSLESTTLLIHGWCCNRTFWHDLIPDLKNKNVINIDLPGHGGSVAGDRNWTIEDFSKDISTIIDHFNLQNVSIIGHSMGGMVALHAAATNIDRIDKLIQLDTFVFDYGFLDKDFKASVLLGMKSDFAKAVSDLVINTSKSLPDKKKQWVIQQMSSVNAADATAMFSNYMDYDPSSAMALLKGKNYWLSSGLINEDSRKRYIDQLESELTLIHLGHFLNNESPSKVANGINYFLMK
ncbi:MAG: alpha/beta hydrolase [Pseudomonadales bacterium]|nr:alpha/beta hydrolase [Pseudomonadales bacterium]